MIICAIMKEQLPSFTIRSVLFLTPKLSIIFSVFGSFKESGISRKRTDNECRTTYHFLKITDVQYHRVSPV